MNEVKPPKVWIGIITKPITKQMEVFVARGYQRDAYHAFMKDPKEEGLPVDAGNGIVFSIFPFDKPGYPHFCIFQNDRGERSILSDSEDALRAYIVADERARMDAALASSLRDRKGTQQRHSESANSTIANYIPRRTGGNKTKRSRKTKRSKRSKRMHTSKRK